MIGGEPLLETHFNDDNSHHKVFKLKKYIIDLEIKQRRNRIHTIINV